MNYLTSPAFTLTTSHKKNILQMVDQDYASPGPKYNTMSSTDYGKNAGSKIGNSKRTAINHWIEQTPSPNQYNPQKTSKQHSVSIPKYKPVPKPNTNPDSGWYNPSSKLIRPKTAQYTLGSRYGSIMDQIKPFPGPAHYETNKQALGRCKSAKGAGFTSAKRFSEANNHPGVGNYKIADQRGMLNNKGSIGNGNRQAVSKPNYPSPDTYLKVSYFDDSIYRRMGKSMSGKLKSCFQNKNETTEAFLKYKVGSEAAGSSNQKFTIPKSKRKVFEVEQQPGPADYVTQQVNLKNTFTAPFYMQKYEEHNQAAQFPGPGQYKVQSASTPKFTIARAKSASRFQDHPGVGRYNIELGGEKKANMFGRSERTNFISKNIAGVGDYKLEQNRKYKGTIGKSQRFKKEQKMPGPGDYQIQSIIGYKSKHL